MLVSFALPPQVGGQWMANSGRPSPAIDETWYRRIVEAASEGIWILDAGTRISFVTRRMAEMLGYEPEELTGRPALLAFEDADRGEALERFGPSERTGGETFEFRLRRKDASTLWTSVTTVPLFEEGARPGGLLAMFTNITERKRAQQELFDASQRLRFHLENSPLAVVEFDTDTRISAWSRGAERIFGWNAGEVLGRLMWEIPWVYEDDVERVRGVSAQLEAGKTVISKNRNYRKDGSVIHCEWYNTALLDPSGKLNSAFSLVLDTTGRVMAEYALRDTNRKLALKVEEFELLFNLMPVGIGIAEDPECRSIRVNRTLAEMLGIDVHENASKTRSDGVPLPFRVFSEGAEVAPEKLPMQVAARQKQEIRNVELEVVRKDGRALHEIANATPLFDERGNSRGSIGAFLDITERKGFEDHLRRVNAELGRHNEALKQFSYAASHDLKEPLRQVSIYSQLLARHLQGKLDARAEEYVGFCIDGAKRTQQLLQALAEYLLAGESGGPPQLADSGRGLETALRNLATAIEESGAAVHSGPLPCLHANEMHLAQLFQNLISNAIKYNGGRRPEIGIWAEPHGAEWMFAVRDNGIGIAPKYHQRIFRVFERLHGPELSGTGVGLAICQKIVERYGGRIWVESEQGKGATFRFTIPLGEGGTLDG